MKRLFFALFLFSCSFPEQKPCEADADCRGERVCREGLCVETTGECGAAPLGYSEACGACAAANPELCDGLQTCTADDACLAAELCRGECSDPQCLQTCLQTHSEVALRTLLISGQLNNACHEACEIGRDWACVGQYSRGGARRGSSVHILVRTALVPDNRPVGDVRVRLCRLGDHICDEPLLVTATGMDGTVTVDAVVPDELGFEGYLILDDPSGALGIQPAILNPGERLVADTVQLVQLVPTSQLESLAGLTGTPIAPDAAHVFMGIYDCRLDQADGVIFTVDPPLGSQPPIYMSRGTPDPQATQTDGTGNALVFNLMPGEDDDTAFIRVSARLVSDGTEVANALTFVRRGYNSYVRLQPAGRD